jgi:hypothetical protein
LGSLLDSLAGVLDSLLDSLAGVLDSFLDGLASVLDSLFGCFPCIAKSLPEIELEGLNGEGDESK